jgi:hypothetical protein
MNRDVTEANIITHNTIYMCVHCIVCDDIFNDTGDDDIEERRNDIGEGNNVNRCSANDNIENHIIINKTNCMITSNNEPNINDINNINNNSSNNINNSSNNINNSSNNINNSNNNTINSSTIRNQHSDDKNISANVICAETIINIKKKKVYGE